MKRMMALVGIMVMIIATGLTAQAKTRNDKFEEMAQIEIKYLDEQIKDSDEFKAMKEEFEDDFKYEIEYQKIETGLYDFVITLTVEEDVIKIHYLCDLYDAEIDEEDGGLMGYGDEICYCTFNDKRVSDEFIENYIESFDD